LPGSDLDERQSAIRAAHSEILPELSISLKSRAPFDRGDFSSRLGSDIKSRVILPTIDFRSSAGRNNMIGGIEISRETRS